MVIQSLELTNFRSFAGATLPLGTERVTMLIGENEAGKSTILDAISYALLGSCRGTDKRGVGADTLIRQGQTAMKVRLDVEGAGDLTRIERLLNAKTSSLLLDGASKGREDGPTMYQRIGASREVIAACLDASAFLSLHHSEAKNLLLDLLEVWVPVGDEQLTLAQVETRYQQAVEQRKAAKQALAAIRVPERPEGEAPAVDDLEAKLDALRVAEKNLLAQSAAATGEASGRRQEITRQLTHVAGAIERSEKALASTASAASLDGAKVSIEDAIEELERKLATLQISDEDEATVQNHRMALVDAQGRLTLLQDTVTSLAAHAPDRGCVLNAAIPCKTPAKHFTAELAKMQQQIDALHVTEADATKAIDKARLRLADQKKYADRLADLLNVRSRRQSQAADLETLRTTQQTLRGELAALPEDPQPSPELLTVQERIRKGEQVIKDARDLERRQLLYETAAQQHREAARKVNELEALCEVLGPKGARAAALQAALGRFEASINAALGRFGYTLRIVAEPWLVIVNDLPVELHSASAQLRIGVALQLALAEASGFGLAVIDQVDLLVGQNRALFAELLSLAEGVQIIAACSRDDSYEPPPIPGWSWLRVRRTDGVSTVEPVGEAVAAV